MSGARMKIGSLLLAGVLLASQPTLAHHSQAMFDTGRTQVLDGVVVEFNWVNPHSSFKVEIPGPDGQPQVWAIEMNSPQNLVRNGWKRTTLKKGDKVKATVRPLRDGKPGGLYVSITLADGTVLDGPAPE